MFEKLSFENRVNAFGGVLVMVAAIYGASELTRKRTVATCVATYPAGTQMSLLRVNGQPMAPAELQARIGAGERGVLERASVVKSDGPSPYALAVKAGALEGKAPAVHFNWQPSSLSRPASACLTYQVKLPDDFDFASGGYLPALFGDTRSAQPAGTQTGFAARIVWAKGGRMGLDLNHSSSAISQEPQWQELPKTVLPRGRWVAITQEVVLNTPNAQNGELRVWVDGELKIDITNVPFRSHAGIAVSGVVADIGYRHAEAKPSVIQMSPLQLAWR